MGERNHASFGSGPLARKKWTLVIAGTAVVLMVAAVAIQVTRATSAFPQDAGAAARPSQAGRASTSEKPQDTKKVAKVGSVFITYDELATECVERHGEEILDNLVNRKIIQQACDAQGVEVTAVEVEEEILKISKKFGLAKEDWLKMLQAERNVTPSQYQRDIIWPMLALKKLAGEEVTITQKEIEKAFVRNYGQRVKARAIVLDNSRRGQEVWDKANKNPDDFERLVGEHSIDPSSRHLGGVIPPIAKFSGSLELEKAAFKLKEGEISAVIQVGINQFIILKCEGLTEKTETKLEDVRGILEQELREEKVQKAVADVFQQLKDEARVDNYLTNKTTGGERRAAAKPPAKGAAVRPAGATGAARNAGKPIADADDAGETETAAPPRKPAGRPVKGR
ncbi:MAG: peptidylprolyl isomerase [Planctomycetaceae bacterium]|nr:peptidylprolyl isomerase [Planctomycetaceae bacterium]